MAILQDQTQTHADLLAQIEALKAQNAKLRNDRANQAVRIKVSEKGAVSVYNLGRFPVTLYRTQMEKLLAHKDEILEFIQDNANLLSSKD